MIGPWIAVKAAASISRRHRGERRPGSDGGDILAEQFRHFSKFVR
jgi:hypothetical protein